MNKKSCLLASILSSSIFISSASAVGLTNTGTIGAGTITIGGSGTVTATGTIGTITAGTIGKINTTTSTITSNLSNGGTITIPSNNTGTITFAGNTGSSGTISSSFSGDGTTSLTGNINNYTTADITNYQSNTPTIKINIDSSKFFNTTATKLKIATSEQSVFIGDALKIYKIQKIDGTIQNVTPTIIDNSYIFDYKIEKNYSGTLVLKRQKVNSIVSASSSQIGTALDKLSDSEGGITILNQIGGFKNAKEVNESLKQLEPTKNNGTITAAIDTQNQSLGTITTRLSSLRTTGKQTIATGDGSLDNAIWGQVFANSASQGFRKNTQGFDSSSFGFAYGVDHEFDNKIAGLSLSYAKTDVDSLKGDSEIESYQIGLYGGITHNNWYSNAIVAVAFNEYDNNRNITIGSLNDVASAKYDGIQYTAKIEGGKSFATGYGFDLTPMASLQYTFLTQDDYSETGSTANLNVASDDVNSLQSGLGAKLEKDFSLLNKDINAEFHSMWLYDFMANEQEVSSSFVSSPTASFTSTGVKQAQNAFQTGFSAEIAASEQVVLSAGYDFTKKQNYQSHSGMLKAKFSF